jgi:hypothetical protein
VVSDAVLSDIALPEGYGGPGSASTEVAEGHCGIDPRALSARTSHAPIDSMSLFYTNLDLAHI